MDKKGGGKFVKVCLVMIVRNEEHCIIQCIKSLRPNLSAVAIVDTGSNDDTVKKIETYLKDEGLHGWVIRKRFKEFAISRNDSLEHADSVIRGYYGLPITGPLTVSEYEKMLADIWKLLITDADNITLSDSDECYTAEMAMNNTCTPPNFLSKIPYTPDSICLMRMRSGRYMYYLHQSIVNYSPTGHRGHKYYCPIHEYIDTTGWSPKRSTIEGVYTYSGRHGGRSNTRLKADRDANALSNAIKECRLSPQDVDRCVFYLAQSYRDAGLVDLSIKYYDLRTKMLSGYNEERYYSHMQIANNLPYSSLVKHLSKEHITRMQMDHWMEAHEICPMRREALWDIMCHFHDRKMWNVVWPLIRDFIQDNNPNRYSLFVDSTLYGWRFDEKACYCAFYAGDKASYKVYLERAIADPNADANTKALLIKHREWYTK